MLGDPEDLPKAEAVECGLLNMTVGARCATLVSGLRMLRDGAGPGKLGASSLYVVSRKQHPMDG